MPLQGLICFTGCFITMHSKFMVDVVHTPRSFCSLVDWSTVIELVARLTLEKKWNFLLKHSTGNVQEISIDIYCSKTVVIPYLGNFKCQVYFLASTEILNFMHFFYIQNA